MTEKDIVELVRMIVVIALVIWAAALATPKNKLPLALRGLQKILRRDAGEGAPRGEGAAGTGVPVWKKLASFAIVIVAFVLAKIQL